MLKGCLSGIKPGRGTNRNEALHKKLNKIVTSSRYGVELAYALFSTIFFTHNEKIAAKIENRREKVILEYDDGISHLTSKEYFGIQCTSDITSIPESKASEVDHLTLQRSSYSDFVHRITDGVKEHAMTGQSQIYQDTFSSQSDDEEFIIPLHALKLILLKALSWYFVHEHMSKHTKRAKIPLNDLPFMNSSLSKLFNCGNLEADQFRSILSDATNISECHISTCDDITSAENLPVISLLPMSSIVIDSHPLFLAFNQDGPGHYDTVSFLDQVLEKENVQADIKCTCGRNSTKGISCAYSTYHYSTKCPCFKSDRSCTHSCRCKGCHNPHGARPDIKKLMPKAGL